MSDFWPTKLSREDFPPSVPADVVERILARQEERDRLGVSFGIGIVVFSIGACVIMISPQLFAWPAWVAGLPVAFWGVGSLLWRVFDGRKLHRVVVEQGFRCPKCDQAMFTDTWSRKKQQAERDALLQSRCPRCFEHVVPTA